jgi:hypothetical protein
MASLGNVAPEAAPTAGSLVEPATYVSHFETCDCSWLQRLSSENYFRERSEAEKVFNHGEVKTL